MCKVRQKGRMQRGAKGHPGRHRAAQAPMLLLLLLLLLFCCFGRR